MIKDALFSTDEAHRYTLTRIWGRMRGNIVAFCMLNPSTADHEVNDPTVERCERRARALGYDGMIVVNLFALRSTDPKALYKHEEPIGPENDFQILQAFEEYDVQDVICAWGKHGKFMKRDEDVLYLLKSNKFNLLALKINKDGTPAHPLYLPYELKPEKMLSKRIKD